MLQLLDDEDIVAPEKWLNVYKKNEVAEIKTTAITLQQPNGIITTVDVAKPGKAIEESSSSEALLKMLVTQAEVLEKVFQGSNEVLI